MGMAVLLAVGIGYLFFICVVIESPEKAIVWELYQSEDISYKQAKQAEITLIEQNEHRSIYESTIDGQNKQQWSVVYFRYCQARQYTSELKFQDAVANMTRQEIAAACIAQEIQEQSDVSKTLEKYAYMTDAQVREQYKRCFFGKEKLIKRWA